MTRWKNYHSWAVERASGWGGYKGLQGRNSCSSSRSRLMDCFKMAIIVTLGKKITDVQQGKDIWGRLEHPQCFAPDTPNVLLFLISPTRSTTNHCKLTIMSSSALGWQIPCGNLMDSKQKVFLLVSTHIGVLMSSAELMSYLYKPLSLSQNESIARS